MAIALDKPVHTLVSSLPMTEADQEEEVRRLLRPRQAPKSKSKSSSPSRSSPSSNSSSSSSSSSSGLVSVAALRFFGLMLPDGLGFPNSIHFGAEKIWVLYTPPSRTRSARGIPPPR